MKMSRFLLLLVLIFYKVGHAKTCSRSPLKVVFMNGQSESLKDVYLIKGMLREELSKSSMVDQKGVGEIIYEFQSFRNDYTTQFDFMLDLFKALRYSDPKAGAAVLKFLFGSAADFIALYGENDYEKAEKKYGELLSGLGFQDYGKAIDQQYELVRDNSYDSQKLMIVSHGLSGIIADGVLKKLHRFEPTNDNILHFMFSPLRKRLGSVDWYATKYLSIIDDPFQASQLTILYFSSYPPTLKTVGVRNRSFAKIFDGYLSDKAKSIGFGPNQKSNFNNLNSLGEISKATETFYGNDNVCCNKRLGKLWIKRLPYRDSDGEEQIAESLGGFIEDGISYNSSDQSLQVDANSVVCKSQIHTNGNPKILGNIDIKGKLTLGDSAAILGGSPFSSPISIDSLDSEIQLHGSTEIKSESGNPIKIKGALLAKGNTLLTGKLEINGESYQGNSNQNYKTAFVDAKISGVSKITKIQGPVLITGKIKDSEIVGIRDQYNPINNWNILNIDSNADIDNANISGIGTVSAAVNERATISGNKIRERLDGVVLLDGEGAQEKTVVSGTNTKITGLVYVKNARITNGSTIWGKYWYGLNSSISIAIQGVEMNKSRVSGSGLLGTELTLSDSDVEGCGWFVQYTQILNSQLYGSRYVSYPLTNQQLGQPSDVETSCAGGISTKSKEFITEGGAEYNRQKLATLFAFP